MLTVFLGTPTVNLWMFVCNPRSEELPLYPLRQIVHPEGSPGIAHGHPHGGEESQVRLLRKAIHAEAGPQAACTHSHAVSDLTGCVGLARALNNEA